MKSLLYVGDISTQFSAMLFGSPPPQLTKLTGDPSDQTYPEDVDSSFNPIQNELENFLPILINIKIETYK